MKILNQIQINFLVLSAVLLLSQKPIEVKNSNFFIQISIDSAFKLAKLEKKILFIDVYTDWCKPCKKMEKMVFPNRKISEKYASSFVSISINAEKPENKSFVQKFNLYTYPTFLYFDSDGRLLERQTGFKEVKEFLHITENVIKTAKSANQISEKGITELEKATRELDYLSKLNDTSYFSKFLSFRKLFLSIMPYDSATLVRICKQVELFDTPKNPAYWFLLDNIDEIRFVTKSSLVDYSLARCIQDELSVFYRKKDTLGLKNYIDTSTALTKQNLLRVQDILIVYEKLRKEMKKSK
jgi:thioredoxin-related protein